MLRGSQMLAYASLVPINHHWTVNFPEHLAALRKQKGMTQQQLADRVGVYVVQLRRYEAGTSQPTLDVIRSVAAALGISVDTLLFAPDERDPDHALARVRGSLPLRPGVREGRPAGPRRHDPPAGSPPRVVGTVTLERKDFPWLTL